MQPMAIVFPVLFTVFMWWFTTGLIFVIFERARWIVSLGFAIATLLMVAALAGLVMLRHDVGALAAYAALTCGIVIWGWHVAGYYLGFVTGIVPDADALQQAQTMRQRFHLALCSSLYHELLALAFAVLLAFLTWGTPNRWGFWIYVTLWLMHSSAKLAVFFGVRNFRIEFLPKHLQHLDALRNKERSNLFLALAVVLASSVVAMLLFRGVVTWAEATQRIGYLSIATLMALGVLEHVLLVIPIPATIVGWGVRALPEESVQPVAQPIRPTTKGPLQ